MALSPLLLLACAAGRSSGSPPAADPSPETPRVTATESAVAPAPPVEPAPPEPAQLEPAGPRVEAWAMNVGLPGRPECLWPVDDDGAACRSVNVGPVVLSPAQAAVLDAWLADPGTFGEPLSSCFIPHHAFTWRDADGAVQRQVSVCVLCDNLRSTGPVAGLPEDPNGQGFSVRGRAAFQALCRELGLPACEGELP